MEDTRRHRFIMTHTLTVFMSSDIWHQKIRGRHKLPTSLNNLNYSFVCPLSGVWSIVSQCPLFPKTRYYFLLLFSFAVHTVTFELNIVTKQDKISFEQYYFSIDREIILFKTFKVFFFFLFLSHFSISSCHPSEGCPGTRGCGENKEGGSTCGSEVWRGATEEPICKQLYKGEGTSSNYTPDHCQNKSCKTFDTDHLKSNNLIYCHMNHSRE